MLFFQVPVKASEVFVAFSGGTAERFAAYPDPEIQPPPESLAAAGSLKKTYYRQYCCEVITDVVLDTKEYPSAGWKTLTLGNMIIFKTKQVQLKKGDLLLVSQDQGALRDLYKTESMHGAQTSPSPNFPPPGSVLKFPLRKFNVIRHPPSPKSLENVHTNSMLTNLCGEALGRVMCSLMFPPLSAGPRLPSSPPRRALLLTPKVVIPDVCIERLGNRPAGAGGNFPLTLTTEGGCLDGRGV